MNQRTIDVKLLETPEGVDVLHFSLDEESVDVNLNSDKCQTEIKLLFEKILELSVSEDVILKLSYDESYSKDLYKDVCSEYIKEIQKEINACSERIRSQLK